MLLLLLAAVAVEPRGWKRKGRTNILSVVHHQHTAGGNSVIGQALRCIGETAGRIHKLFVGKADRFHTEPRDGANVVPFVILFHGTVAVHTNVHGPAHHAACQVEVVHFPGTRVGAAVRRGSAKPGCSRIRLDFARAFFMPRPDSPLVQAHGSGQHKGPAQVPPYLVAHVVSLRAFETG